MRRRPSRTSRGAKCSAQRRRHQRTRTAVRVRGNTGVPGGAHAAPLNAKSRNLGWAAGARVMVTVLLNIGKCLVWGLRCQEQNMRQTPLSIFGPPPHAPPDGGCGGTAPRGAPTARHNTTRGGARFDWPVEPLGSSQPHPCIRRIRREERIQTMMQVYASAARLRSSGCPISCSA
jgi:hypothetical protein